jgi:WD40 repeat protein
MTTRLLRLPLLGAALSLALSAPAADPPADPLPKGAKARLGTTRMRDATNSGWNGAALTPDGKFLVGPSQNGLTKFDVTTGQPAGAVGPKPMGFGGAGRVELSADGTRGVSVNYNGVSLWAAEGGKVLIKVERPMPYTEGAAALSADGSVLALGGTKDDRKKDAPVTALVWDVAKNEKRAAVAVVQNQYANVALSPDGKLLATWGSHFEPNPPKDGTDPATDPNRIVQFWDAVTGKELAKFRSDGYGSGSVVFAPDGQTVAVSPGGGSVRLVDPKTGAEKRRLFARGDQGSRVAFSPDGKTIASAGLDGTVQLWGTGGGSATVVECPVGPLAGGVRGLRFTAPDRAVVWANVGSAALVWEVPSGKLLSPPGGHVSGVQAVTFAADGKEVWTGGTDGRLLRWETAGGKELGEVTLRGPGGFGTPSRFPMGSVRFADDGKTAVAERGGLGVYDLPGGRQLSAPTTGLNYDFRTYLCSDARTLLTVPGIPFPPKPQPKSLKIAVWDVTAGAKLAEVEMPVGELVTAAVTPDRSKLITGLRTRPPENGKAEFLVTGWELATGKKLGELAEADGYNQPYLTPAPDNKAVLASTAAGRVIVVDVGTGKMTKEIDTNRQRLTAAAVFGPGGKQFAAAYTAGFGGNAPATVRVYDWESGKAAKTFQGHTAAVSGLAFSPDGKVLATGSGDTTVLLWDLTAGGE